MVLTFHLLLFVRVQELVALFSREGCPKCVTCEFADNNCWYVTFDSEESTQEVSECGGNPSNKGAWFSQTSPQSLWVKNMYETDVACLYCM